MNTYKVVAQRELGEWVAEVDVIGATQARRPIRSRRWWPTYALAPLLTGRPNPVTRAPNAGASFVTPIRPPLR